MNDSPAIDELLTLRQGLGIVHHVPGRIRLRLGPAILAWARSLGLKQADAQARADSWLVRAGPGGGAGVLGTRLNPAAASLVIEYDPLRLDPAWWETLVLGEDDEALALVLGLFGGD
jgi:hypothetical protein